MKNKLTMKYPSSWWGAKWREALPSGNGTLGAAVYGAVHDETILLTHEALWHREVVSYLPDVSGSLSTVRTLLAEQKFNSAERLLAEELKSLQYKPKIGCPLPLGDLKLKMPVHRAFRKYRRTLDMETGEVEVSWLDGGTAYTRKTFVSRPGNFIAVEVTANKPCISLNACVGLHDLADIRSASGEIARVPYLVETKSDPSGYIRYAAMHEDETDFGAVARVAASSSSGKAVCVPSEGGMYVEGADRVLIVIKLSVKEKREVLWQRLSNELSAMEMDYNRLFAPHAEEHRELFNRVSMDLGATQADHGRSNEELLLEAYEGDASTALVEKMWAYGRYLLISSSRPGGLPCPLHGKWCGSYVGMWTFHMANENIQMIYWQSLSGNLAETHIPVFDYYDGLMGDFRINARQLYGCRGIFIPAVTTPASGLLRTRRPHIIHWTGAAAWIAQHYYDYYQYTGDEQFLRERAYPFMKEVALFYQDFFTVNDEGYFVSSPSNSPENTPGNFWDGKGMGAKMETTINATMDFALAKEVLTHLVETAEILEDDADEEVANWKSMLSKIPPYEVNADGAVKEWMHPFFTDNYHHRHQSHLYPIFPGLEVTEENNPELFTAFETAIQKRFRIGISEQTGWSLVHMANARARLREGNEALECLNLVSRSCLKNNFYTTHNDWRNMGIGVDMEQAPFQVDANMGWTAAIQEMLLFSLPSQVKVLPALPDRWPRGSVSGLVARGGVHVSIEWDVNGGHLKVGLCSPAKDQEVLLHLPFGTEKGLRVGLAADQETFIEMQNFELLTPLSAEDHVTT